MATTTYLSNPAVLTVGGADLRDQASAISFTLGYTPLPSTAFGDDGERSVKGLQTVEGTLTLYVSYGATEVEGVLAGIVGDGTTTIVFKKGSGAIAADNPELTISNTMVAVAPYSYTVGEMQVFELSFEGGTWVRDVTP